MNKLVSIAFIIVIIGGLLFGVEVVRGTMCGKGLMFAGICTGIASLYLIVSPTARKDISSGFDTLENIVFDVKFDDMTVNGHIIGSLKSD
jgi:hypothetical protein